MQRIVPKTITAGVNFSASAWDSRFSGAAWEMRLIIGGQVQATVIATRDGARHVWDVPAATTAAWSAGEVEYSVRAYEGDDVFEVEFGRVRILGDIANGGSTASPNRIALEAIEAVLAKRATLDQQRYRINNRELYRESIAELIRLRDHYAELCAREDAAASGRKLFGKQVKIVMGGVR